MQKDKKIKNKSKTYNKRKVKPFMLVMDKSGCLYQPSSSRIDKKL